MQEMAERIERGFTLAELVTAVAVTAILTATALPFFVGMQVKSRMRTLARQVAGDLSEARLLARTGRTGVVGWGAEERVIQAGVRFDEEGRYVLFVDSNDRPDGQGEQILTTVEVPAMFSVVGSPAELRFRRNGCLAQESDAEVEIRHSVMDTIFVVTVSHGGGVVVEPRG